MNMQLTIKYRFILPILFWFASITLANVEWESCKDFFHVSINGDTLNFESELQTITKNNLASAIDKINNKIGRRSDLINRNIALNILWRLNGIGLYRLGGGDVNCFIGIDNAKSKLLIIDSKNGESKNFEICGPVIKRKKGFPWFSISWECKSLWSYSCAEIKLYGEFGGNKEQFKAPTSIVSDGGDQLSGPVNLWVADNHNNRIVHLRYSTDGKMSWINSIGNFNKPVDLAYKRDSETPVIYVACQSGSIIRIPVTDSDFLHYQQVEGNLVETGYGIDGDYPFENPTGICLNQTSDIDGWNNSINFLYVADAGKEKIYRYMETGSKLQYLNSVSLPSLNKKRYHIGIKSDRFGTLYVFDREAGKVLVYSPSLEKISEFGSDGDHSSTAIKFNGPKTGFITGDNLMVVDHWSDNSGMQKFNISGIDILSATVDYSQKTAIIVADNAFKKCSYSIDGGTPVNINGLQYSGSFPLDLSSELEGLSSGQHTLIVTLKSAFDTIKTCTKTIGFIVDPNAARQPRNIKIGTIGRRVDISWQAPQVTAGLSGYAVYINGDRVYDCDAGTVSYSYYAPREPGGVTLDVKLGAIFEQAVNFTPGTNFNVLDNSLEHESGTENSATSVQQFSQVDWNSLPIGTAWTVNATMNAADPTYLRAEPMISVANTPIAIQIKNDYTNDPYYLYTGCGTPTTFYQTEHGDRIRLILVKKSSMAFDYRVCITRSDGGNITSLVGSAIITSFPLSVVYHSNMAGLKLSNCTIGLENAMSTGISVTLRAAGDVKVDGSDIALDDAVNAAFNGDNLLLSDAQYTLSVPLNNKPDGDNNVTPVRYTISLNSSDASGKHAIITYGNTQTLINSYIDGMTNLETDIHMSGIIFKSNAPLTVLEGNYRLSDCDVVFSMQNCVIDAPAIALITEFDQQTAIPAGGVVNFDLGSSTMVMGGTNGLIRLKYFTGLTLNMSDNLIYQKDFTSCFCFADTGIINLCSLPNVNVTGNSFLLAQVCTGCANKICTPAQNEIATLTPNISYLGSDYGITNIANPGITRNGVTGEVEEIRGSVKTVDGMSIDSIIKPKILLWPNLLARSNPNPVVDSCMYLPVTERSKVNTSMNSIGIIRFSDDILFTVPENYTMLNNRSYLSKEIVPGEILYAYGENSYGLHTKKFALSFPGSLVFDEQAIGNFYGAPSSAADVFVGDTSSDAASGVKSWKVESLSDGNGGYQKQRTESFYEPLPDVTGYETLSFYYKKQYVDQQFSLTFEDTAGVTHTIQNTALPSGVRGWQLTTDAATLNWQHAVITIKDEDSLATVELPMNGKLMRLSIHHQSASAGTNIPVYMLFDSIVFKPLNTTVFDEHDPVNFIGKGGSDGWDGLTSNDAFSGAKSFQIAVKMGNNSTSDEWAGLNTGIDLPIGLSKRKFTFAYKKSDSASFAKIKLHIQNMETNAESVFEISEQTNPQNITNNGWPIPKQNDTRWHQVFIDLYSVRGVGNIDYPSGSFMPFGKLAKIELCLNGTAGAQCLFDDIKFVQDFYQQTVRVGESYSVSPEYTEIENYSGWKINGLSKVNKNTVLSYGTANNVSIEENYNLSDLSSANISIASPLEVEKNITISDSVFQNTYICWNEKGASSGVLTVDVQCSDGKVYPLSFSPSSYGIVNSRGICNKKAPSDLTETRHSYKIVDVFREYYPELSTSSISPISLNSLKIQYKLNKIVDWYSHLDYNEIEFIQNDSTPSTLIVSFPVETGRYGMIVPVSLTGNKEIASVRIFAKRDDNILKQWQWNNTERGQTSFSKEIDIRQIADLNPNLTFSIIVTDIYGHTTTVERNIVVDNSIPTLTLFEPNDQFNYNGRIPIYGTSDIPLKSITYQIKDLNGVLVKDSTFIYLTETSQFYDSVNTDGSYPQDLIIYVFGTSSNGLNSTPILRNIRINPPIVTIGVGTVTNPTITWNPDHMDATFCGASASSSSLVDNLIFGASEVNGNFEATLLIKNTNSLSTSAKAGLMARSSFSTDAINDFIYVSNTGIYTRYRSTSGQAAIQNTILAPYAGTIWFKMKRVGSVLTYYTSTDGMIFTEAYTREIGTRHVYVGPAYTSGDSTKEGCATFTGLSIEKLPDGIAQVALGVTTETRILPTIVQDGVLPSIEDKSTRNSGETISVSGVSYSTGIGGMPQSDGAPSFLIYDLKSEASRLQIEKFTKISGMGGTQDGATPVTMQIRVASSKQMPSLEEWLTPTGQVYIVWNKPSTTDPKSINLDLTGVTWLGIFMSANPMYTTRHGVWGNLTMDCIGSERKSPVIVEDPKSITRLVGERAVFSVKAEGTLPLTYQWQKNHMNIADATSSAYMTTPVELSSNTAVYRCVVTNDFGKDVSIDAILTVVNEPVDNVSEFALIAKEYLNIRDHVSIVGSTIMSNALLDIDNDGNIKANILAVGNVHIGDRTGVTGNVVAGGSVALGSGVTVIDGSVMGGQSVSSVEIECRSVTYGASDITVNNGITRDVIPGDYRDLHAYTNSILRFVPGTYNLRKCILESNVKLIFELDADEKATINIYDETKFGDACKMTIEGTASVFNVEWYSNYAQEIPVRPGSSIIGQMIMPLGTLHIYSQSIVNGLCHAKNIIIEPLAGLNFSRTSSSNNQKPVISVPAASAEIPVTGTTANMSVLGVDDGLEKNLSYSWTAVSVPTGAWVNFSKNNSNEAKNTKATFSTAGSYTLRATAEDQYLLRDNSTVIVTVNQTLTSITVSPTSTSVVQSTTKQFSAIGQDQFAANMTTQPAFTWSVSSGGTISTNGLLTATTQGYSMVTATSGSVNGIASVSITPSPVYKNNCGGSAISSFNADQYFSGGTARSVTNTITTTGVANAAPQAVYQSERYGTMTYTIPGLVASAQYTVRLHFAELYWAATGMRAFNVVINGMTVLSNYDIYAAAGAQYKAVVKDFAATANSSGQIVINLNTVTNSATIGGIEIIRIIPNNAPTITTAASSNPSPVLSNTASLLVLGGDDYGEANLTYTWATTGTPPAAVSFSANGTNAAKTTTATFTKAGSYTFQATIKDAGNLTVQSNVTVAVNQSLTSISVSPASIAVYALRTKQFSATASDQFGTALSTQPTFTWSVSGGGTIGTGGLLTAGTEAGGPYTVTATSGTKSSTSSVTVTPAPVYEINCGGSASSPFLADQYYSGGTTRSVTNTITTTDVTNAAPQAVYQSERYGAMTYTIPSLVDSAEYTVRFHFAELYWTATGKRAFNVVINGTTVLSNYDIYAIAGAQYKAVVRDLTATANASGQIVINLNTVTDNATICGIEIIRK